MPSGSADAHGAGAAANGHAVPDRAGQSAGAALTPPRAQRPGRAGRVPPPVLGAGLWCWTLTSAPFSTPFRIPC
jgi:hypothetical protein